MNLRRFALLVYGLPAASTAGDTAAATGQTVYRKADEVIE